ncbi:acetoin utilization protein AcuC [Lolliginicoccus levis]|uniref:acetoin utilization protein AcuC n=1 Tax=Lolliginicoccus levis TaxID=2919542 RepID=UPI00241FE037|nr:acetoin utilization protein AcuC [Lolliginicoccus levis]
MGRNSVSVPSTVVWTPEFLSYRLGATHPMNPVRLELAMALAEQLGALGEAERITPGRAGEQDILRVHTLAYMGAVKHMSDPDAANRRETPILARAHGLGTDDTPIFPRMHDAAAIVTGGSLDAAREIHHGRATRAVSIAGGMHHAMPDHGAGFCVYNDCAIAIDWLLEQGHKRIVYIDVDVHHGDGVQRAFYDDPRVMTISIHQHPATLWPGTGWPAEAGGGSAEGTSINLPLLPGTTDEFWLRAFHAVVPGAVRAFAPDIIVSQCGVDSHRDDPLADLALTVDGQRAAFAAMRDLADEVCGGRWLAVGGGGYSLHSVVPRSWAHLIGLVTGSEIEPAAATPPEWQQLVRDRTHMVAPTAMSDGGEASFPPWGGSVVGATTGPASRERNVARVDSAILETRRVVYPLLGLDPDDPRD